MDVMSRVAMVKEIAPSLKLLTKSINSVGDYLFFSHIEWDKGEMRYLFSIYLARRSLRTDLSDIENILSPLVDEHSDLFTIKRMTPIELEGLFVTYQIDISISEYYTRDDQWTQN